MPIVTMAVPRTGADPSRLAAAVADGVASALLLGDGDVIAMTIGVDTVARSGGLEGPAWPVVSVHGNPREDDKMDAALAVAERAVRDWAAAAGVEIEGVWTEWLTPRTRA